VDIGAIAFIYRFGVSLNEHVHFHVCVVDGVFAEVVGGVIFHPASGIDADAVAQVQATLRRRILRAFVGRSLLQSCDAKEMLGYQHSGFSVDAGVRIESHDRAALELIARIAALVPPPRTHRHRYFGVLAPNSPLGAAAVALAAPAKRSPAHYLWAVLIARIYEVFPLLCPLCGGQMRLIAFITE
jgi:hypothetical protein